MVMMGTLAGLEIQRATGWVALWKSVSGGFQRRRSQHQHVVHRASRNLNLGFREIFAPISRQLYPDPQN
jgi:hypothetical protein